MALAAHVDAARVSADLPLRANLSALENVAISLQYRQDMDAALAQSQVWQWFQRIGMAECAAHRNDDLDFKERFASKFLRAWATEPAAILIDRPALLLPDVPYARWLPEFLEKMTPLPPCYVVEYEWNRVLWR